MASLKADLETTFKAHSLADWEGLAERACKDADMSRRNERIYKMKCAGTPDQEIADAVGVKRRWIQKIIRAQVLLLRGSGLGKP